MDTSIKACKVCLNTEVKMHYIDNVLEHYLSLLAPHVSYRPFPSYICYECKFLLVKYIKFRKKYVTAQSVLLNMFKECDEITEQGIKEKHLLTSVLNSCLDYRRMPLISMAISDTSNNHMTDLHEEVMFDNDIKPDVCIKPDIEDIKPGNENQLLNTEHIEIHMEPYVDENGENIKLEKEVTSIEKEQSDDMPFSLPNTAKLDSQLETAKIKRSQNRNSGKIRQRGTVPSKVRGQKRPQNTRELLDDDSEMNGNVTIVKLTTEEQLEELKKRQESSNYLNAPFQCNICYKGFVHTHAWKHHLLKHDPNAGDLECHVCKIRFRTKHKLSKHVREVHSVRYICKLCPAVTTQKCEAKRHQKWHKGVTYKCKHCNEVSTKWTSYLSHLRIKHPSDFICDVCGYSFVSKLGLTMHKTRMHKKVPEKIGSIGETNQGPYCKECDITFVSEEAWNQHMVIYDKHKQTHNFGNLCRVCGKSFESLEDVRVHHRKEHTPIPRKATMPWPAKCELCSEELANTRQKWYHYRDVHPNNVYPHKKECKLICDTCGKSFCSNAHLVQHMNTHSEEKQFKCGTCGKGFYNRINLQKHETQTHSELRPYVCTVCTKAFKCKSALKKHSQSHTGAKPYKCELCDKWFSWSYTRKLHVRAVHMKQPAPPRARRATSRHALPRQEATAHSATD